MMLTTRREFEVAAEMVRGGRAKVRRPRARFGSNCRCACCGGSVSDTAGRINLEDGRLDLLGRDCAAALRELGYTWDAAE